MEVECKQSFTNFYMIEFVIFLWQKIREIVAVISKIAVDNFDLTRKIVIFLWQKLRDKKLLYKFQSSIKTQIW